jgi:hypothetical protein
MTEALSSEEATKRWEFLLGIKNLKPTKAITSTSKSSSVRIHGKAGSRKRTLSTLLSPDSSKKTLSSSVTDQAGDPYDCSSMTVLPTQDIVENAVHQYLEEWKKLDDRKIYQKPTTSSSKLPPVAQDETETHENEKNATSASIITISPNTKASINTNHGGGWRAMEDRLSLPDGFDYNTKSGDQQWIQKETPLEDGYSGDFVISLKNPTQRLSYHKELSKLFDSIPTCRELEEQTRGGHKVRNTLRVYQKMKNATRTAPECYALARLRVPDRHGLPQSLTSFSHCNIRSTERRQNQVSNSNSATVLLEFWRRKPNGCMSSGCHRMAMEFLASQTLWDVHVVLSQMAEDELWVAAYGDKATERDNNISDGNASMTKRCNGKEEKGLDDKGDWQQNLSGCFFIENTFYKTGPVDYTKPIIDWIDGSKPNIPNPIRRRYLGVDPSNNIKHNKTMKRTKLSQVPFRPNIRYYHACHGDVETTVMLVDRRLICQKRDNNESVRALYPLIHDIWTAPRVPAVPLCDACQNFQSVFKTSTNCKTTDGGPRSLCQECCKDLNLLKNEQYSVKLYGQWHDQANLSIE